MTLQPANVGIDLGGTWLRLAAVTIPEGRERYLHVPSPAENRLPTEIRRILRQLKIQPLRLCIGARGVWSGTEKARLRRRLTTICSDIEVLSDVEAAWRAAFGRQGSGVVVVSGTGSIAYGRDANGRVLRAGGWGPLLGDEGSAFWIGREWLRRNSRQRPPRPLLQLSRDAVRRLAFLSKKVLGARPEVGRAILHSAQSHLAELCIEAVRRGRWEGRVPVSVAGSVLEHPRMEAGFRRLLLRHWPLKARPVFTAKASETASALARCS